MPGPPPVEHKVLGRQPRRSDHRALMLRTFMKEVKVPKATKFWRGRKPFPLRTFGNTEHGSCTRSKQAIAAMRMERIETRRTPSITDEEVVRVYYAMTERLYGAGDTGAYEVDALSEWRKPDLTFRDTKGRPLTIDAYLQLNPANHDELRQAIWLAGAHGIAVCLNLPWAFSAIDPPNDWDVPEGQSLTGAWVPGSWGGHSMWATDYDEIGPWLTHTWGMKDQRITWKAAAIYLDEAHLVIDSVNAWKKRLARRRDVALNMREVVKAVNDVSSYKLV